MCMDSVDKSAKLPKSVMAYKQFFVKRSRAANGQYLLGARYRGGLYVRNRIYNNEVGTGNLWTAGGEGKYEKGYHAYAYLHIPIYTPPNVEWFLVKLTKITAAGRQNTHNVYVAQRMKIIKQVKV